MLAQNTHQKRATRQRRAKKRLVACNVTDVKPGGRLLLDLDGKSIGLFNIDGDFYALHNRCPHMAGSLCEGPITGTALPTNEFKHLYGREGELIRCAWHGWEFEIKTGQALIDPRVRARKYDVTVEEEKVIVHI